MQKTYPYQNKTYENLPFEKWSLIPGSDDMYEISDLGRVRSLDRWIETKDGRLVFYKGFILSQPILKYKNNFSNDYTFELVCSYRYKGKKQQFSVRRMVYSVFVKPINFRVDNLVILHIDGDHLNTAASNLIATSIGEKSLRIYKLKRCHKLHTYITPESKAKGISRRFISITQYSLKGERLFCFASINSASTATGIDASSICAAAKGIKQVSAGGFLWQYGDPGPLINTKYYEEKISKSKK